MKKIAGFTLIEAMVAITILAFISLLIWQSSSSTLASKERFEAYDEKLQSASLVLQQITRDLQAAYLYSNIAFLGQSVSGEQRTKSVFIGRNEGDQDRLIFNTFAHIRYREDERQSDQAEVSYFLEPDPERSELFFLKKRVASPPDALPEEGGASFLLLDGVREFNLRYYDPNRGEFQETWDSMGVDQANRLPRAVEILLVLADEYGGDEYEEGGLRFETVVFLGLAPGPNDF